MISKRFVKLLYRPHICSFLRPRFAKVPATVKSVTILTTAAASCTACGLEPHLRPSSPRNARLLWPSTWKPNNAIGPKPSSAETDLRSVCLGSEGFISSFDCNVSRMNIKDFVVLSSFTLPLMIRKPKC